MRRLALMMAASSAAVAFGVCSMSIDGEAEPGGGDPVPAPLTFGEKAVGLTFNPGGRTDVDDCKRGFARLIDDMNRLRTDAADAGDREQARLASVAITELQGAQMWAVKALTWTS